MEEDEERIETMKEACFQAREAIEAVKEKVNALRSDESFGAIPECGANLTLAFRHLEDAKMRVGKAIQAIDGGTSCYPR